MSGGCWRVAEGIVDRVSLVGDDVVAQTAEQFGFEVVFLILVLAGEAEDVVQDLRVLGIELVQGGFKGLPTVGKIQADAAERDGVGGHKGGRRGIFGLDGEDFQKAAACGFGSADEKVKAQAVGGGTISGGGGSQAGETQCGQGSIGDQWVCGAGIAGLGGLAASPNWRGAL